MDDLVVPVVWLKWITISSFTKKNGVIFKAARIMADLASEDSSRLLSSFESVLKGRRPPRGWTLGETVGPGRVDQVPLVRKSRGRNL